MAAPTKKRDQRLFPLSRDDDQSSSSSENDEKEPLEEEGMEIQVDFEGRYPVDPDYHGIKTLLQQLFLKAHVDLGGLADLIIRENYVGSVVKQSADLDESDDEDNDVNDVFGITTVINLSSKQNYPCIQQLRELLTQMAKEHATDTVDTMIKNLLEDETEVLGLLINERFVNIPAQISVPLLENLMSDIKKANNKKMPFDFSYYILICKFYKTKRPELVKRSKSKKKDNTCEQVIVWSNPEEEIFAQEATISFEFSVEKESDSAVSGTWTESDDEMTPYRRVLLFEAFRLQSIIDRIKSEVP
ncbi:protein BCCIP homolog isoform X1 [Bombus vancouverensis nearcticus]|uniref:Protein BCCIP homolog n=2 Tax=Bombus bifarius TaxID=103933 RepID=A0A6P8MPH5_9HYME|nr:protein BCCIP homolog isoform X1 [Bombus vancouverensis nearcticus]XP_033310258.1 protein BCCIP homolog isoform X1 [Bombus bifarius]